MMKHIKTKSDMDFILKVMSVFEGFQYKGKKYLSYIESRSRGDEFLIRDNIVKPFFTDVLGYDKQKDFIPEEKIETGKPDTQIVDTSGNPVIVIETLSSSSDNRQFEEHRKRLFDYTDELGSKIAVLSNGIVFNAYWNRGRGKAKDRLVFLRFDELYKKFVLKGLDGLDLSDWEKLLMLKYLTKELQIINPEELYKEPKLDISEERHFSNFLEQLISSMGQIKTDVKNQFELHQTENTEYRKLKEVREESGRPIYASESKKFALSKKCIQSFHKWHDISSTNRDPEVFQLETMYIFFNRILLLRICEDKGIIKKRKISNGGIKDWMTFKGFTHFSEVNYNELIKEAYKMMEKTYPHLFREDIFDWYMPNNEILLNVLFIFNPYNFKSVDRDILGKLYEKYIPREERKKLGQFYTPEEVINYILDAVGYREDADIEGKKLLDPACGSGGFLVRAANILIQRLKSRGFDAETILNKVRDNIYGFEINPFACHLTEINLLFQIIDLIKEAQKKNPEFEMYKFNIFETDSLRIPKKEKLKLFKEYNSEWFEDAETVRQIKIKEGKFKDGFDFVVGNPPYIDVRKIPDKEVSYLMEVYKSANNRINTYGLFIELGISLLKLMGKLGFITSNTYLTATSYHLLRKIILDKCKIDLFLDLKKGVFEEATVETVIMILSLEGNSGCRVKNKIKIVQIPFDGKIKKLSTTYIGQDLFNKTLDNMFNIYLSEVHSKLVSKMRTGCNKLSEVSDSYNGINPGNALKDLVSNYKKDDRYKKVIDGRNIDRYSINYEGQYILYDKEILERSRDEKIFISDEKLIFQKIGKHVVGTYDNEQYYTLINTTIILLKSEDFGIKYLLALLNSKLMDYYYTKIFVGVQIKSAFINQLPIKPAPLKVRKEFVSLIDQILMINKALPDYEAKISNIQKLIEDFDIPYGDLADISGIRLELKERIGKPKIVREGLKVYLDRKSYIECENAALAEYIELYLSSIDNILRGKIKPELVKLIKIPKSITQVKAVLNKRKELLEKIETLKLRRNEIDREINQMVYKLYGLTEKEIKIVDES